MHVSNYLIYANIKNIREQPTEKSFSTAGHNDLSKITKLNTTLTAVTACVGMTLHHKVKAFSLFSCIVLCLRGLCCPVYTS
ncbi:hypothetical protein EB796_017084 [Bugula neritina]|uniref:Uncharacterized protein n=1 Tax=Bugula neritina TaxID=10212 RepID=A0A7J7JEI4_BUGNE|nr:hypothetical protein EB796_017084 [Bugula neritina]